jgi:hypothetical protein
MLKKKYHNITELSPIIETIEDMDEIDIESSPNEIHLSLNNNNSIHEPSPLIRVSNQIDDDEISFTNLFCYCFLKVWTNIILIGFVTIYPIIVYINIRDCNSTNILSFYNGMEYLIIIYNTILGIIFVVNLIFLISRCYESDIRKLCNKIFAIGNILLQVSLIFGIFYLILSMATNIIMFSECEQTNNNMILIGMPFTILINLMYSGYILIKN